MVTQQKVNIFQEGDSHQFAFYNPDNTILQQPQGAEVLVKDEELVHRVVRIVKLKCCEKFVVFDQKQHVFVELIAILKREIKIRIISCHENIILQPRITWFLPLLKKEALEEAVYSLAELGINEIQLVSTAKSRRELTDKEFVRLQKIVVAAAEQSKHYAFPLIYPVKNLQDSFVTLPLHGDKIVYDISGESFFEIRNQITSKNIYIVVGPEGGLAMQELGLLKEHGFKVCSLTPTVLRALQAVAIGGSLFRLS